MTNISRLLSVAAVCLAASLLPAKADPTDTAAATPPQQQAVPIPTLHCDFKTVMSCGPDGTCKAGKDLAGMPLPLKVTADFENSIVAAVDDSGYARTDKFDSAAESDDQLILHGIDGAFGWQLIIQTTSQAASMSFASADATISGFGTCTNK
jgi:hypothetical protein